MTVSGLLNILNYDILSVICQLEYLSYISNYKLKKNMFVENWKTVDGFMEAFGTPDGAMLMDLTRDFIETYHKYETDPYELVNGFGIDWVKLLLNYNEETEEYENCVIFRDLINDYKQLNNN
jgi:hypothetical protein